MHVGGCQPAQAIHRFVATPTVGAEAPGNRVQRRAGQRVVIGVTAQGTFRQLHRLQGQGRQALLHGRLAGQQAEQFGTLTGYVSQGIEQV